MLIEKNKNKCVIKVCAKQKQTTNHVIFLFFLPFFVLQNKNNTPSHLFHFLFCVVVDNDVVVVVVCCSFSFVGLIVKTAGSLLGRLEMRLLLWDGGYFPINLKFSVSVRTEGGVLPSHFQVRAGSRQLLYSLQRVSGRENRLSLILPPQRHKTDTDYAYGLWSYASTNSATEMNVLKYKVNQLFVTV